MVIFNKQVLDLKKLDFEASPHFSYHESDKRVKNGHVSIEES